MGAIDIVRVMVLYQNLDSKLVVEDFCLHCHVTGGDTVELGNKDGEYGSWHAVSAYRFSPTLYVEVGGKWFDAADKADKFTPIGWESRESFFVGRKLALDERTMLCPSELSDKMFTSPLLSDSEYIRQMGRERKVLPKNCQPYHDGFVVDVGMGQFGIAYQFDNDAFGECGISYGKLHEVPTLKKLYKAFGVKVLEFLGINPRFADIAVKYGVLDTELGGIKQLESVVNEQEMYTFIEMCIDDGLSMSEGLELMGG